MCRGRNSPHTDQRTHIHIRIQQVGNYTHVMYLHCPVPTDFVDATSHLNYTGSAHIEQEHLEIHGRPD
jgi:hypothetical protein